MECTVHVSDADIVEANASDFPLTAPRFSIQKKSNNQLYLKAQDYTALRAASNALFTILAVADGVKTIQ